MSRRIGRGSGWSLGQLLGLLAFYGCVCILSLLGQCFRQNCVGLGVGWVCGDCRLELCNGFGELTTFEEETAAVEREVCTLPADGDATEIGGLFAFGDCTRGVALPAENGGKRNVGTRLVR